MAWKTFVFIFTGDVEFKPATLDLPDDEETIAAAEEEEESDVEEELADLKKQNEMDLNELIETLPPGFLLFRIFCYLFFIILFNLRPVINSFYSLNFSMMLFYFVLSSLV